MPSDIWVRLYDMFPREVRRRMHQLRLGWADATTVSLSTVPWLLTPIVCYSVWLFALSVQGFVRGPLLEQPSQATWACPLDFHLVRCCCSARVRVRTGARVCSRLAPAQAQLHQLRKQHSCAR